MAVERHGDKRVTLCSQQMDLGKMEYQTERRSAAKVRGNDWAVTMTRGLRGWWLEVGDRLREDEVEGVLV